MVMVEKASVKLHSFVLWYVEGLCVDCSGIKCKDVEEAVEGFSGT